MKIGTKNRSDQWNADDFVAGKRIFQIANVRPGSANDAEFDVDFTDSPGKCWRPPYTVIKILMGAWRTDDTDDWIGKHVELYRDETVKFGKDISPGIRVSRLSHISKPYKVALNATRGKKQMHEVEPLETPATLDPTPHLAAITTADTIDTLKQAWQAVVDAGLAKHPGVLAATNARKAELAEKQEAGQ